MIEMPNNIGWVGLGTMGFPMAMNLLKKLDPSTQFHVHDVSQESVDNFVLEDPSRVYACASSKDVADKSDITLTMVPESSHALAVYLDPTTGIIQSPSLHNKMLVDCSTISPQTSLEIRSSLLSTHPTVFFTDCPVSGGVLGATAGTLTFMLGLAADSPQFTTALHPLFSHMGSNIIPCGGPSLGLIAKLANNYTSSVITLATCDAFKLGMHFGMDPRVLANVFHTSTAQSAICDDWNPVPGLCPKAPSSRDYEGGFRLNLMAKDVGLAVESATTAGVGLSGVGEKGLKVYREAEGDERCVGRDSRVVYRFLGGVEGWQGELGDRQGEVGLVRDETRRLLALGRERDLELKAQAAEKRGGGQSWGA
ncbi:hypothetical protein MBLNU230_g5260t1 [Neophaeotheca triangularis]